MSRRLNLSLKYVLGFMGALSAVSVSLAQHSENASSSSEEALAKGDSKKSDPRSVVLKAEKSSARRYFYSNKKLSSSACPCVPLSTTVPENLTLPSLGEKYYNVKSYGPGLTYHLVDEESLPQSLRKKEIKVKRTGYSKATNNGHTRAGWAAIKRRPSKGGGTDGLTHLGTGTLNSPITVAISPELARNEGLCQGDMLYDPSFGWLRIEGGCTQKGLGSSGTRGRVDIWRGTASRSALDRLTGNTNMTHFPAGLIDHKFALKNPGPKK